MIMLIWNPESKHFGDKRPNLPRRKIDNPKHLFADQFIFIVVVGNLNTRALLPDIASEVDHQLHKQTFYGFRGNPRTSTITPTRISNFWKIIDGSHGYPHRVAYKMLEGETILLNEILFLPDLAIQKFPAVKKRFIGTKDTIGHV